MIELICGNALYIPAHWLSTGRNFYSNQLIMGHKLMTISFKQQVAIVTGAGTGLGRAHALLLASRGAKVVVNDPGMSLDGTKDASKAADIVVAEIKAAGGEAVASYDSVAEIDGAQAIVKKAISEYGRIDIVVNNAGILRDKTFAKMTMADFDAVMKVHLYGSAYVSHAAWPYMKEQGYGRIILTSSASGLANPFGQANYAAAKSGMIGLMLNLKHEGAKYGIKVNSIIPVAATRMTDGLLDEAMAALLKPEQISPAVAWLSSSDCDVSGEIIAAGAGYFTRIKIMKAQGAVVGKGGIASIEDFAAAREQIFASLSQS